MTPEHRIDILECAVADLQRELREFHGYAPPSTADLIDHTLLEELPGLRPGTASRLRTMGITSIERLARIDWTKPVYPYLAPADLREIRPLVDAWAKERVPTA